MRSSIRPLMILILVVIVAIAVGVGVKHLFRMGMQQGYAPEQPIHFSHKLHAGDNKVPCLYCHYGARSSRHAGIPSSSVCMNCHNIMEKQTVEIERFKEAAQLDQPTVQWTKVHNLPDFVYFNHSRHVLSGAAELGKNPNDTCEHCHGDVKSMTRIEQKTELTMGWCLSCHREHATIPTFTLERAAKRFSEAPKPPTGTDCASCHY